jgi:hypothetical protein
MVSSDVDPRPVELVVEVGGPTRALHDGRYGMAKYLLLIYGDERQWAAMPPQEQRKLDEAHRAFSAAAGSAILDGQELEPAPLATTLRADPAGRLTTTDGPFLETKEAVGGYYLVEASDLDEVIGLASRLYEASAGHSGVEIRPVVDHG